jgi:antitoxin (DNA-binding transcriptional repressor) of toxin-antitoxin stability system
MDTVYSMTEAKRYFDSIAERASRGESFIITRYGKPIVKIAPPDPMSDYEVSNETYKTEDYLA